MGLARGNIGADAGRRSAFDVTRRASTADSAHAAFASRTRDTARTAVVWIRQNVGTGGAALRFAGRAAAHAGNANAAAGAAQSARAAVCRIGVHVDAACRTQRLAGSAVAYAGIAGIAGGAAQSA